MFPVLSFPARLLALCIAFVAMAALLARFIYDLGIGDETPGQTLWSLLRFFTILTNVLVALTFARLAVRRNPTSPPWVAALTLSIMLVGTVYHVLLAHLVNFTGLGWWADHGLHTAVPIGCFVWWLFFAPKRELIYADLPMFIVWPCVYVAYALARGAQDGIYPYPFLNLSERSSLEVTTALAGLLLVSLIGGVMFVMIGKFADR